MVKMPFSHKLLITAKIVPPKKYKKFLSGDETTTGFLTKFDLQMQNIGKNEFPGGFFVEESLRVETSIGIRTLLTKGRITPIKIGNLKSGDTRAIKGAWTARVPGCARIVMDIKATDKEKIDFFQSLHGVPSKEWTYVFNIVDRHQLDMVLILSKLLEKR